MNTRTPVVLALLVTALAVAGGGAGAVDARLPQAAVHVAVAATPAPPAAPAAPAAVARPATAPTTSHDLVMPDGKSLPPLNGAIDPPRPRWQRGRPYSPVVGTVRLADGRDAYLHADGTRTITFQQFRKDLNREVAVTAVSSPVPSTGTLAEELPSGH